jgi:hypothetical protein
MCKEILLLKVFANFYLISFICEKLYKQSGENLSLQPNGEMEIAKR